MAGSCNTPHCKCSLQTRTVLFEGDADFKFEPLGLFHPKNTCRVVSEGAYSDTATIPLVKTSIVWYGERNRGKDRNEA